MHLDILCGLHQIEPFFSKLVMDDVVMLQDRNYSVQSQLIHQISSQLPPRVRVVYHSASAMD